MSRNINTIHRAGETALFLQRIVGSQPGLSTFDIFDAFPAEARRGAHLTSEVTAAHPGFVMMKTRVGGTRVVDMLSGEQLPRIC